MSKNRTLMVTKRAMAEIQQGNPLLTQKSFLEEPSFKEGEQVILINQNDQFLAMAYLAKQNKGIGWVYAREKDQPFNRTFFTKQFERAKEKRKALLADDQTTAFRLFNAEGDGIPGLTIDYYDGYAVFSWYSQGVFTYHEDLFNAFKDVFPLIKGVYEKYRYQQDDETASDFRYGEKAPEPLMVKENGIRYATYLDEGWMTGIFLDQRHVRNALLEKYSMGKTILNTFSYTGAFSVAAAMGGASYTTSVDVAKRSLEKTREQFEVNGLNPDDHLIRVMDVFDYIRYAKRKELQFDVIVVDPPSFARTKKRTFSVVKDYGKMVEDLIDISTPDGIFIFSSNAANYNRKVFRKDIATAFQNKGVGCTFLEEFRLPEDFSVPENSETSNYLKVFFVKIKK